MSTMQLCNYMIVSQQSKFATTTHFKFYIDVKLTIISAISFHKALQNHQSICKGIEMEVLLF